MRVNDNDRYKAPKAAVPAPAPPTRQTVAPVDSPRPKERKWSGKITAAALYEARYGRRPKPTHTPDELAALKANNDPRLTRSGVIMVPSNQDDRRNRDR